tara:strand:+ start:429 stop:620 length:192 start_codon:yes stop_codon:yes gene_type:complete
MINKRTYHEKNKELNLTTTKGQLKNKKDKSLKQGVFDMIIKIKSLLWKAEGGNLITAEGGSHE